MNQVFLEYNNLHMNGWLIPRSPGDVVKPMTSQVLTVTTIYAPPIIDRYGRRNGKFGRCIHTRGNRSKRGDYPSRLAYKTIHVWTVRSSKLFYRKLDKDVWRPLSWHAYLNVFQTQLSIAIKSVCLVTWRLLNWDQVALSVAPRTHLFINSLSDVESLSLDTWLTYVLTLLSQST